MYKRISKFIIIIILLFFILFIFYKDICINFAVKKHLIRNNIEGYHIVNVEKFPAMYVYLVRLENGLGDFRNLTIISEILPLDVIYDSKIDKQDMK